MVVNDLLEWASDRPLFTLNDAERALGLKRASLREKLSRLSRRDGLHRIERGKYTVHEDPMVYATYVETPSYLSLWSGLRFHQLTTQQPARVQVITARNRADLEAISFYRSDDLFGFGKEHYDQFEVFVADPERLLVDCLSRKHVPVSALTELVDVVDPDRAADYANRFGRHAVRKRVGYLLERHRGISLDALRVADRNYPVLDLAGPHNGAKDARWRLTVNTDVE